MAKGRWNTTSPVLGRSGCKVLRFGRRSLPLRFVRLGRLQRHARSACGVTRRCARKGSRPKSIASKLLSANVIFIYASFHKHLSHRSDHRGWARDVVDRSFQVAKMLRKHFAVNKTALTLPLTLRFSHLTHRGNEHEMRIRFSEILQISEKRGIFRAPIGIEEIKQVRKIFL